MFCPFCGNNLNDSAKFCPKCGKQVPPKKQKAVSTPVQAPVSTPVQTPVSTPVQTPVQTAFTPKPVKPVKPPKVKKVREPLFTKSNMITFSLNALLFLIYCGIAFVFILLLNMDNTISVNTISDYKHDVSTSLSECLDLMINGNRIFNPTALTIVLGLATYILVYATPVFALLAFVCYLCKTKDVYMNIANAVVSVITAITVALCAPLAVAFASGYKQALSINAGVIFEDIESITPTTLLIFVGIVVVLIIASFVVTTILRKRRAK